MRQMKDSGIEWIKQIPTGWSTTRGKNILQLMKRPPEADDEVITCFRDGEVTLRRNRREEGFTFSDKEIGYQGIKKGDLVVHGMDGFAGAIGISDSDGKGSPVLVVCTTKENTRYLMYYLRTLAIQDVFLALATGIRERSCDLRWNKIADLLFPVPELNEQCRIVDYLDRKCSQIDAIIARQQEVIEKLKAYRLSVITEAVTKGLNPDVHMKDSGVEWIGKIPEHWKIGKLCFFTVRIGDGLHGTPEFDDAGEYYFINGNNLGDTYITIRENTKSVSLDEYNKYFIALNENTLLISLNGTIGNVSQYHGEQIILGKSAGYIIVDSRRELTIDYLKFYLQSKSVKTLFELSFAGTTINNLSLETLRNLPVCIMTGEEQFHIAKFLEKKCARIDQVIQKKTLTIDKLNEYKKSLIYEVVTGKREV